MTIDGDDGASAVSLVTSVESVVTVAPVLESMRAREPGLQAPSNLTGSKIKNTHIFLPLLILSQRYEIQYLEEHPTW